MKEAAAQLRVSTATVYGLCERGRLPYVRVSVHAIRIAEADLSAFIRGLALERGMTDPAGGAFPPIACFPAADDPAS